MRLAPAETETPPPASPAPAEPRIHDLRSSEKRKRDKPETVEYDKILFTHVPDYGRGVGKLSSHVWFHVDAFKPTKTGGRCGKTIITTQHMLFRVQIDGHMGIFHSTVAPTSNIIKYLQTRMKDSALEDSKCLLFALAVNDIQSHAKGGSSPGQSVTLLSGQTGWKLAATTLDARAKRPHHLRAAAMLASAHLSLELMSNESFANYTKGLNIKYGPPAQSTIKDYLCDLYKHVVDGIVTEFKQLRSAFFGLPWGHLTTDLWTDRFAKGAYSSIGLRVIDPATARIRVYKLGVVKMTGKHTAKAIGEHIEQRLAEFELSLKDIASTTTDSGANIRKLGVDWQSEHGILWTPCILHSLHNAVKYGLGLSDEKETAELVPLAPPAEEPATDGESESDS